MDSIKRYMLNMPPTLWAQLVIAAKRDNRTVASAIRQAITNFVEGPKK